MGDSSQYDLGEIFDQNNVILCYTNGFKSILKLKIIRYFYMKIISII